jgi:tetratricopeptide (TPR) repeat protein
LSVRRSLYGDNHAEVARSLINLGALYVKQSAYDKAEPLYVEAVHVAENLFGPQHPQVAMLLYSLANIYHIQGRLAKAESQHLTKDKTNDTNPTAVSQSIAKASSQTTQALKTTLETTKVSAKLPIKTKLEKSAQIKFKQALPLYERALKILDSSMGGQHPAVTAMVNELAMLYKSIGDTTNAQKMQARLSSIH